MNSNILIFVLSLIIFSPYSEGGNKELLPKVFFPLTWNISSHELKDKFPEAEISATSYKRKNDKFTTTMVNTVNWPEIGETSILVTKNKNGNTVSIELVTAETRTQCNLYSGKKIPAWCRNRFNTELVRALETLRGKIVLELGPEKKISGNWRYDQDPRQIGYVWRGKLIDTYLSLSVGEENDWAVELSAIKKNNRERGSAISSSQSIGNSCFLRPLSAKI